MSLERTAWIDKVVGRALGACAFVAGCLVVFQMIVVCLEVFLRYCLNKPTTWVIEIASYILVWVPFLCVAWVQKRGGHIKMDLIYSVLSPKAKVVVDRIHAGISILVCAVIIWYGVKVTSGFYQAGTRTQSYLLLPQWPLTAIIPFSLFLLCLEFLRAMRKKPNTKSSPEDRTSGV